MALNDFRFPFRDVDIWGLDEYGEQLSDDDKAAALDANQRANEDYLSNTLPQVYIQQSGLASGTIDPSQLATGTAGTGKAPISQGTSAPAWIDVATQAELDSQSASIVAYVDAFIQRGRISVTDLNGTNTIFAVTYATPFSAVPRITLTAECGAGISVVPTLHAVNTTSFAGRVFITNSTTATCFVHWHAVKA